MRLRWLFKLSVVDTRRLGSVVDRSAIKTSRQTISAKTGRLGTYSNRLENQLQTAGGNRPYGLVCR